MIIITVPQWVEVVVMVWMVVMDVMVEDGDFEFLPDSKFVLIGVMIW